MTDLIAGVSVYNVKWLSGNKSSFYEFGLIGVDGLADDEGTTNHEPVT